MMDFKEASGPEGYGGAAGVRELSHAVGAAAALLEQHTVIEAVLADCKVWLHHQLPAILVTDRFRFRNEKSPRMLPCGSYAVRALDFARTLARRHDTTVAATDWVAQFATRHDGIARRALADALGGWIDSELALASPSAYLTLRSIAAGAYGASGAALLHLRDSHLLGDGNGPDKDAGGRLDRALARIETRLNEVHITIDRSTVATQARMLIRRCAARHALTDETRQLLNRLLGIGGRRMVAVRLDGSEEVRGQTLLTLDECDRPVDGIARLSDILCTLDMAVRHGCRIIVLQMDDSVIHSYLPGERRYVAIPLRRFFTADCDSGRIRYFTGDQTRSLFERDSDNGDLALFEPGRCFLDWPGA